MEPTTTPPSDARTRVLWVALVAALLLALGAGAWTYLSGWGRAASADGSSSGATPVPSLVSADEGELLPAFSLTDRSGRAVSLADLQGKVWVADFIFTRCPNICPELTRKMHDVRKRLDDGGGAEVLSVSITVDPKHDTPKVLAGYAESFHASPTWLFLTGEPRAVYGLVTSGFHLAMADPDESVPGHSNRFVLVDAHGKLRGTHLGTEEGVVDAIVKDALTLQRESRQVRG